MNGISFYETFIFNILSILKRNHLENLLQITPHPPYTHIYHIGVSRLGEFANALGNTVCLIIRGDILVSYFDTTLTISSKCLAGISFIKTGRMKSQVYFCSICVQNINTDEMLPNILFGILKLPSDLRCESQRLRIKKCIHHVKYITFSSYHYKKPYSISTVWNIFNSFSMDVLLPLSIVIFIYPKKSIHPAAKALMCTTSSSQLYTGFLDDHYATGRAEIFGVRKQILVINENHYTYTILNAYMPFKSIMSRNYLIYILFKSATYIAMRRLSSLK